MEINGLTYIEDFLSEKKATELIEYIHKKEWGTTLKRRTQHYGHIYQYNHVDKNEDEVKPIPKKFIRLFNKLRDKNLGSDIDINKLQVIVNEYEPGQGIGAHIDDPHKFGDWIISVSLNSDCAIVFTNRIDKTEYLKKRIRKNSVYQMTKDARYKWTHQINQIKVDNFDDGDYIRKRRISVTFRYMKKN